VAEHSEVGASYESAELLLPSFLETEDAAKVIDYLQERLVESVNQMDVSDDPDEAENQLRNIVLNLQIRAFLAGSFWSGNGEPLVNQSLFDSGEELSIELTSDQKLELTRSLLNGDGISLKIL
jgi:hypothetical protein